jgi:hypothetical protein
MVSIHNASFDSDSTYAGTFIALWKVLEATFGVKCGCLPALKPLIMKHLPKSNTSSANSKTTGLSDNNFNRYESATSRSHIKSDGYIDLQDLRHASLPNGAIGVTSETTVRTRRKADLEGDEWMFEEEDGKEGLAER